MTKDLIEEDNRCKRKGDIKRYVQGIRGTVRASLVQETDKRKRAITNVITIIQIAEPATVSFRFTASAMLIPIKKIGARLQNISK